MKCPYGFEPRRGRFSGELRCAKKWISSAKYDTPKIPTPTKTPSGPTTADMPTPEWSPDMMMRAAVRMPTMPASPTAVSYGHRAGSGGRLSTAYIVPESDGMGLINERWNAMKLSALDNETAVQKGAAWVRFLKWAKTNRPEFYARLQHDATGMNGLGITGSTTTAAAPASTTPWWESLAKSAGEIYTAYRGDKRQDKVLELQLEQARQGQTPTDMNDFATAIRLQHEVDLMKTMNTLDSGTKNALYIGGAILGAILLMPLLSTLGGGRSTGRSRR